MELNFQTLTKLIKKDTEELLENFIEEVHQMIECITFLEIAKYILKNKSKYNELCTYLAKDLKGYEVAYDDSDDLTCKGEDFLITYIHYTISEQEWQEWRESVGV